VLRFFRIGIVLALIVSIGAHWAVLQSAAWLSMAVTYTLETGSLNQGLSETFDGDHPCALCLAVQKGQRDQQQTPGSPKPKDLKLELFLDRSENITLALIEKRRSEIFEEAARPSRRAIAPILPPPRVG
jgi:hypothetical protein